MEAAAMKSRNRQMTPNELEQFGQELDALRARTVATLGQADADYIRGIVKAVRYLGFAGRLLLFSAAVLGAWIPAFLLPGWVAGVLALTLSKILENMELG